MKNIGLSPAAATATFSTATAALSVSAIAVSPRSGFVDLYAAAHEVFSVQFLNCA
jgi:hypothetical protein